MSGESTAPAPRTLFRRVDAETSDEEDCDRREEVSAVTPEQVPAMKDRSIGLPIALDVL